MKIKQVKRINDNNLGMDGLEVTIEQEGKEYIECFVDAEDALTLDSNGKERFINKIKENIQNKTKKIEIKEQSETNLNKYGGKEI